MATKLNPFTGRLQLGGGGGGGGDVSGPGSSTDMAIARFSGTSGKIIENSLVLISDTGQLQAPNGSAGAPSYSFSNALDCGMFTDGTNTYISGSGFATLSVGFNVSIAGGTTSITQGVILSSIKTKNNDFTCVYGDYEYPIDTSSAPITANLMNSPITGQILVFKDNSNNAATNNITISGLFSGKNIDGVTTQVINTNGGSLTIQYNGVQWNIISKVGGGAAGIGGTTGSTDNAIIRADGTGGSTVQGSTPQINDDGQIIAPSQFTSQPSYAFIDEPGLGFYRSATGTISQAVGGNDVWAASDTGFRTNVPLTSAYALNLIRAFNIPNITTPSASPYVASADDLIILINTSTAYTVQLPDSPTNGQLFFVKDALGTGATINNITVTTVSGSRTFDSGGTSTVINTLRGGILLCFNQFTNNFSILARA